VQAGDRRTVGEASADTDAFPEACCLMSQHWSGPRAGLPVTGSTIGGAPDCLLALAARAIAHLAVTARCSRGH
jgi:hypothetical protein